MKKLAIGIIVGAVFLAGLSACTEDIDPPLGWDSQKSGWDETYWG